jgi:hypothetical protein
MALLNTGTEPLVPGAAGEDERTRRMALLETARREGMRSMGQQWARSTASLRSCMRCWCAGMRPVFSALTCPTLLVCGRQDTWSSLERHERMQQALPHAHLVPIEDAGHMTTVEQPEAVSRVLLQWVLEAQKENGWRISSRGLLRFIVPPWRCARAGRPTSGNRFPALRPCSRMYTTPRLVELMEMNSSRRTNDSGAGRQHTAVLAQPARARADAPAPGDPSFQGP